MKTKNMMRTLAVLLMIFLVAASAFSATIREATRIDSRDGITSTTTTTTTTHTIGTTDQTLEESLEGSWQADNSNLQIDTQTDENIQINENTQTEYQAAIADPQNNQDAPTQNNEIMNIQPTQTNLETIIIDDIITAPIEVTQGSDDDPKDNSINKTRTGTIEISEKDIPVPANVTRKRPESIMDTKDTNPIKTGSQTLEDDAEADVNVNVLTQAQITQYKQELAMNPDEQITIRTAKKLIDRKRKDQQNYDDIISIVRISPSQKKEIIASELADLDNSFVSKLRKKAENSQEDVQMQIEEYALDLEQKETPRLIFDASMILDVFSENKSFEEILSEFGSE